MSNRNSPSDLRVRPETIVKNDVVVYKFDTKSYLRTKILSVDLKVDLKE